MSLHCLLPSSIKRRLSKGYTLVELMVVFAIMSIMLAASTTIMNGISNNQSMSQVANTLGATLEIARNTAMAHNTYVWVGFPASTDASMPSGLELAAVESLTGQQTDLGVPANLRAIMKPRMIPNVSLNSGLALTGMDTTTSDVLDVSSSSIGSFTAIVSGTPTTFSQIIQFSPQGETMVKQNNLVQWVNVELQPIRGQPSNRAALQVSGTTGEVRLFQP